MVMGKRRRAMKGQRESQGIKGGQQAQERLRNSYDRSQLPLQATGDDGRSSGNRAETSKLISAVDSTLETPAAVVRLSGSTQRSGAESKRPAKSERKIPQQRHSSTLARSKDENSDEDVLDMPTEYLPTPTPFDKPRNGAKPRSSFTLTPSSVNGAEGAASRSGTTPSDSRKPSSSMMKRPSGGGQQQKRKHNDDDHQEGEEFDDGLGDLNSSSILVFDPNAAGNKESLQDALSTMHNNDNHGSAKKIEGLSSSPTLGSRNSGSVRFNAAELKLSELCESFVREISNNTEYRLARAKALDDVIDLLEDKGYEVDIYGSAKTGLMIPSSDFDITLAATSVAGSGLGGGGGGPGWGKAPPHFNKVAKLFMASPLFKRVLKISHARIPVIKCEHAATKMKLDISFNRDGIISSRYLLEKLRCSPLLASTTSSFDHSGAIAHRFHARQLILLVKHLLGDWNLDDPACGGLGSFGVSLLVLFFCDSEVKTRLPKYLWSDLGTLFVKFLLFYGETFRFDYYQIDIEGGSGDSMVPSVLAKGGGSRAKQSKDKGSNNDGEKEPVILRKQYADRQLYVKNPLEPSRNALSACKKFDQIKEHFSAFGRSLQTNISQSSLNIKALQNNFSRHFSEKSIQEAPRLPPVGGGRNVTSKSNWSLQDTIDLERRMGLFTSSSTRNGGAGEVSSVAVGRTSAGPAFLKSPTSEILDHGRRNPWEDDEDEDYDDDDLEEEDEEFSSLSDPEEYDYLTPTSSDGEEDDDDDDDAYANPWAPKPAAPFRKKNPNSARNSGGQQQTRLSTSSATSGGVQRGGGNRGGNHRGEHHHKGSDRSSGGNRHPAQRPSSGYGRQKRGRHSF